MERRICNNCHSQLQVPPKATTIRCKCQALYTVGSSSSPRVDHNGSTAQKQVPNSSMKLLRSRNINNDNISIETSPWLGFSANLLNSTRRQPRKALLIGVSYQDQKYQLNGTINDTKNMWNLLTYQLRFPKDAICVLTDDNLSLSPTKENMQRALKWLVQDCQFGDSLVFYFSGHGLRQHDFNNDEIDGYDETLCPVDFKTAGMIFDNDINDVIVKPLKPGVKLHAIVDACHSGTILDLEHVYSRDKLWIDNKSPSRANKSPIGGVAISLSACADNKMAVDTTAFSRNATDGALTYIFTKIMKEKGGKVTYAELLNEMQKMIESVNDSLCLKSSLIKRLFRNKIVQEPQISASQVIDINGYLNL
ncbi:metacaspase-1-like isoform X2 [Impatiens glandulifera]|uniref:metacaspase-1-like isoform X2 n=1 Tax=Impatiens glandulifera TaxID=253017 RepID=UPI001FB0EC38|nr:metacaspase-1-like isoform X2 [Impatiens glandulifera]